MKTYDSSPAPSQYKLYGELGRLRNESAILFHVKPSVELTLRVVDHSSWIAARVFASAHTNPIYVTVGDAPILSSRKSIQWCLDSVDRCWESKSTVWKERFAVDPERDVAPAAKRIVEYGACRAAYEQAREPYRRRLEAANP